MTSLAALVIIITIIIIIENGSDLRSNELYLSSSENKAKKIINSSLYGIWTLRYRYSALPAELTSQILARNKPVKWWINDCICVWKSYIVSIIAFIIIVVVITSSNKHDP